MLRSIGTAALAVVGMLAAAPSASARTLVPCAREHEFCRVPYPTQVVYGIPGRSTALEVRGRGVPCSNEAFGDPAQGVPKRCAYVARGYGGWGRGEMDGGWRDHGGWAVDGRGRHGAGYDRSRGPDMGGYGEADERDGGPAWRTCAPENGFCGFGGVRRVRYGVHGRFVEGTYRGGVSCSNSIFGDPVPGQPKLCQVLD